MYLNNTLALECDFAANYKRGGLVMEISHDGEFVKGNFQFLLNRTDGKNICAD
jgi:hypothetical protein